MLQTFESYIIVKWREHNGVHMTTKLKKYQESGKRRNVNATTAAATSSTDVLKTQCRNHSTGAAEKPLFLVQSRISMVF